MDLAVHSFTNVILLTGVLKEVPSISLVLSVIEIPHSEKELFSWMIQEK